MKASRLLSILISLQGGDRVTAEALARRFEVSKRTIYRDLDELSAAGVPVRADRGVGGGIALDGRYTTDLSGLSAAESAAFAFAGLPDLAVQLGVSAEARAARIKLLSAMGKAAGELAQRFHLDPSDWYDRVAEPPALRAIATAVSQSRRICIRYSSWQRESMRLIDPLGLVVKAGQWYVLARAGRRIAIYRVAAVREVQIEGTCFRHPDDFDLVREWRTRIAIFETSLERMHATVRVRPEAMDHVHRLGAAAKASIEFAPSGEDGVRVATIPIEGVGHAAALLLGFADSIEVMEPSELREEIAARGRRIVSLYRDPAGLTGDQPQQLR